jgi:hypothetical protein
MSTKNSKLLVIDASVLKASGVEELSELKAIAWINPDKPEESPIAWLKCGANPEPERLLGFI